MFILNGHSVNKAVIAYASMNINPFLMIKEINIAIGTDNGVFRPMVGIPTGTNSAPLVACIHVQCYDDFPSYYLRIKKHLSQ